MIYFLFKLLLKLVASSFCKKVADLYDQRSRRVSVGAYWNPCQLMLMMQTSLLLVFFSNFILLQNNSDAKFGETMLSSDAGTK